MGTRSLTVFLDAYGKEIAVLYRQFDGYPTGHGADLKEFFGDMVLVNGIGLDEKRKIANGMGCLAAQVVANFKKGVGGIYLYPTGSRDCDEDYIYTVSPGDRGGIHLKVTGYDGKFLYDGNVKDFNPKKPEAIDNA
jgi:hypothetical protein